MEDKDGDNVNGKEKTVMMDIFEAIGEVKSDVKNILGLKKHRNIGSEFNEDVLLFVNKTKLELKEKREQKKLKKILSEKSSIKIRDMNTQVAA